MGNVYLKSRYRLENIDGICGIATLRRDNAPKTFKVEFTRSKIQELKTSADCNRSVNGYRRTVVKILNAPKQSCVVRRYFFNRPIGDNWQSTVQQLSAWAQA